MIDVFYYYFYLAYKNVTLLYSPTPRASAAWSVGILISFWVITPINLFLQYYHGDFMKPIYMFSIGIVFFLLSLYIYQFKGRGDKVIKRKPAIFDSPKLSAIITIVFFILSLSLFFLSAIIGRQIK